MLEYVVMVRHTFALVLARAGLYTSTGALHPAGGGQGSAFQWQIKFGLKTVTAALCADTDKAQKSATQIFLDVIGALLQKRHYSMQTAAAPVPAADGAAGR